MTIAKTGFLVSLSSYVLFFALDWLRPGFVSDFLSVHLFLLAAIIFGVWWAVEEPSVIKHSSIVGKIFGILALVFLSVIVGWFAWREGRPFADFRPLVALIGLGLPSLIVYSLTRS